MTADLSLSFVQGRGWQASMLLWSTSTPMDRRKVLKVLFFNFVLDIFPVFNIFFILLYMILPVLGNTWLMDVGEYSKSCDLCEN